MEIIQSVVSNKTKEQPKSLGKTLDAMITDIAKLWQKGQVDRLELGEQFSELRKKTASYKKGGDGMSYNEAVKRTGVPHSTAEKYRAMYETCTANGIPPNNFLLLCEAGLNLGTVASTKEGPTVAAILQDHPELKSEDTDIDFGKIKEQYVKQPETGKLPEIIAELESTISDLEKLKNDALKKTIDEKKQELYGKQESALKAFVTVLAPFIGWDDAKVDTFIKELKADEFGIPAKFKDAVKLAQTLFSKGEGATGAGAETEIEAATTREASEEESAK